MHQNKFDKLSAIKIYCALDGVDYPDISRIGMAVEVTRTPRALYRHLLRQISLLPQECREYYKHYVRQVLIIRNRTISATLINIF